MQLVGDAHPTGLVTRRSNALTRSIAAFDDTRFGGVLNLPAGIEHSSDEIGRLAATFSRMARRITMQFRQINAQYDLPRQMVANVSLDLRTPLTSMQGYLETMQRKSTELSPEESANYLRIAVQQSQRVAHLAEELFELAKLECEEVQPDFERFAL